ncbi:ABC transporter permease [Rhizobium leguminosarum]|uniref:ABC transporter permease n=1 Tax=Rhizobium leguminosarum TaxID=384 RepID=UPI0024A9CA21|nr:ABC transporter permease [Rhizobium leguminosarum]MDI5929997.1 ABC transporter permease [Rhizobium leguminosarum]
MEPTRVSPLLGFFGALVAVWLVAPNFVVIPISFTAAKSFRFPPPGWSTRWYESFFQDTEWLSSAFTSMQVAIVASILATLLGTAAAYGIVRGRFIGKKAVQAFLIAPMIVPVIITGVGTYAVFLQWGLVGSFSGFVTAHTVLAIPLVVITVGSALVQFDQRLEDAAAICGSSPVTTFRFVTLPLILPSVMTAAVFAFITSFDEVVLAIFLSSPNVRTLPVQLYNSMTQQVDPTVAVAATLMLCLTTIFLTLIFLVRRKAGNNNDG